MFYENKILDFYAKALNKPNEEDILEEIQKTLKIKDNEIMKDILEIKDKMGYMPSEIYLYDDFTVKEMLDYHESFYKKDIHKRRRELVRKLELDEKKKIEDLSLGNLKK